VLGCIREMRLCLRN